MKKTEKCYTNRELSWLQFNERVLNEAGNPRVPLAERMTFASIYQTNLDEFFMVRVGTLMMQMNAKEKVIENKTGMTSEEQVKEILARVCLSENIPLVFYDSSMSIVEVIASGAESKTGQLIISGNFGTVACERFDLFNGKSIIPIPELEPGFYTIELSIDKNVFAGDFFIE